MIYFDKIVINYTNHLFYKKIQLKLFMSMLEIAYYYTINY